MKNDVGIVCEGSSGSESLRLSTDDRRVLLSARILAVIIRHRFNSVTRRGSSKREAGELLLGIS